MESGRGPARWCVGLSLAVSSVSSFVPKLAADSAKMAHEGPMPSSLQEPGPLWSPCPRSSARRVVGISAEENSGAKIQARFPSLNPKGTNASYELDQFRSRLPPGTSTCARSASSCPSSRHRAHAAEVEMPKRLAMGLSLCPAMRMDNKI